MAIQRIFCEGRDVSAMRLKESLVRKRVRAE